MLTLTIRQAPAAPVGGSNATVSVDAEAEYPFTPEEERRLHLRPVA